MNDEERLAQAIAAEWDRHGLDVPLDRAVHAARVAMEWHQVKAAEERRCLSVSPTSGLRCSRTKRHRNSHEAYDDHGWVLEDWR